MVEVEERIDPTMSYQAEYSEWAESGCRKAEELLDAVENDRGE